MNNQIKGMLYFFVNHTRHSFVIFWSILLSVLFVSLSISYLMKGVDGFMTISLTGPMYVYCGIYGFIIVKNWIPFFIKLGATRKNILISLGIFFIGVSIGYSAIATALQSIVSMIKEKAGLDVFSFLHLSYFFTDTWYTRMFIDATLMMFFFTLLFVLGLLFYKYGLAIGGTVLGIVFVTMLLGTFQGWLSDFVIRVFTNINLNFFWQLTLVAVVLYLISWFFMRKITIVNTR